jgi:formylglycine-generating enzyme required for sulfatase activity
VTERAWVGVAVIALCACRSGTSPAPAGPALSAESATAEASASASASAVAEASADAEANAEAKGDVDAGSDGGAADGMLLVAGGTFTMGSEGGGEGDEHPAHPVTVAAFWLDRTEVTQHAYDECVVAKACPPPDAAILATFQGLFKGPNKPVVGVSWFAARDYCAFKGKRLPREAEFERAVRGDDGRRYPWGNDAPTHERTVFETNATEDVATHPTGRGPYGHEDLAGNVWEWIADDYDPLAYSRPGAAAGRGGSCEEIVVAQNKLRSENKQGFTGSNPIPSECEKSIRGGAYNYPAGGLRSTNRIHHPPSFKLRMTGLRCAKDA